MKPALTYDDVILVPRYSDILPSGVDLSVSIKTITLGVPFISAPMDTVTESEMVVALGRAGGIGIIHRNMSIEDQVRKAITAKMSNVLVGAAVGTRDLQRVIALKNAGIDLIYLDSAHAHSENVLRALRLYRSEYSGILGAGNVVTPDGAQDLANEGIDLIGVGLGPSSICTTRVIAGVGLPQLSAVMECAAAVDIPIIADGGIRSSGDIVKALAAGASLVMCGRLFAEAEEAAGLAMTGRKRLYRGMGSQAVINAGMGRYGEGRRVAEGIEITVPIRGSMREIVEELAGGLRQGMGYLGVHDLTELRELSRDTDIFRNVSQAGYQEGLPAF